MKFHPETSVKAACLLVAASAVITSASAVSLPVTYFDFLGQNALPSMGRTVHPDFNLNPRDTTTPGMVGTSVGANGPTFVNTGGVPLARPQLTTAANLDMWYVNTPAYNMEIPSSLNAINLGNGQRQFNYPSDFFPLDGQGLGDFRDSGHNFHFTMKYEQSFMYDASLPNLFDFAADDDLYVFINGNLWVDLGGIKPVENPVISKDLNADAGALGLVDGGIYTYQLFFAERHTTQSALIATLPGAVPEASALMPAITLGGVAGLLALRRRKAQAA
ncbi:MAG: fibro-slime domain-containing protein [Verrucomicrobia bacterium]|nr:fibro-slime domain-containing protein [Verrucomicrobiota bacterium]